MGEVVSALGGFGSECAAFGIGRSPKIARFHKASSRCHSHWGQAPTWSARVLKVPAANTGLNRTHQNRIFDTTRANARVRHQTRLELTM